MRSDGYEVNLPAGTTSHAIPASVTAVGDHTLSVFAINGEGDDPRLYRLLDGEWLGRTGILVDIEAQVSIHVGSRWGSITGTPTLPAGVTGDLRNARVACYASYDDWNNDRVLRSVNTQGTEFQVSFTIADLEREGGQDEGMPSAIPCSHGLPYLRRSRAREEVRHALTQQRSRE